jgi:hypothetical protein
MQGFFVLRGSGCYIMPPMPPIPPMSGAPWPDSSFGASATMAYVVSSSPETDAAFCSA